MAQNLLLGAATVLASKLVWALALLHIPIVVLTLAFHFIHGLHLRGLVLAGALWILIPGTDELWLVPILTGLMGVWGLAAYYGLGVALLALWWFVLR